MNRLQGPASGDYKIISPCSLTRVVQGQYIQSVLLGSILVHQGFKLLARNLFVAVIILRGLLSTSTTWKLLQAASRTAFSSSGNSLAQASPLVTFPKYLLTSWWQQANAARVFSDFGSQQSSRVLSRQEGLASPVQPSLPLAATQADIFGAQTSKRASAVSALLGPQTASSVRFCWV